MASPHGPTLTLSCRCVNHSDPFGLCPPQDQNISTCPTSIQAAVQLGRSAHATNEAVALFAGGSLVGGLAVAAAPAVLATVTVRAAPAVAAATAAASKIPFDDFQEWGRNAVGWGKNAAGAINAMGEMTAERAATIDPAKVQMARQFYENAVANGKGGAAAPARVELMDRILELQQ